MEQGEDRLTVLYSANFVFICPNCRTEHNETVGRKKTVYTCRGCDKQYSIQISIGATDREGNTFTD